MDLIFKLFNVLFPVFLTIAIGYWYGKKDPKFDTKFITTFSGTFGLPCIIFYSLTVSNLDFQVFLKFSYYIIIYVGIFSIIGIIVLKFLITYEIIGFPFIIFIFLFFILFEPDLAGI